MQLTLHLTDNCNLDCKYCFIKRGPGRMSQEVAFAAVRLGMKNSKSSGLLFYGGEPLLERELIYEIAAYTKKQQEKTGCKFYYKMTTNGTLLDEEFLKFAQGIGLNIGFSHDGPAQDDCRRFPDKNASALLLEEKIPVLLKYQPYAVGMSVIDPSTVHKAAEIVRFLSDSGFRYITMNLNYDRTAHWTKKHLEILGEEYRKMADMYISWAKAEKKIYLSPFDLKIVSHIKGEGYNRDRRLMAVNQPSVATDGIIYISSRHIGNPDFAIGDVFDGLDRKKQKWLYKQGGIIPDSCGDCVIKQRCNYVYDSFGDIAAVQCAHEQLITPIADYAAEKLYSEGDPMFMHKHYNDLYPILSLLDDKES